MTRPGRRPSLERGIRRVANDLGFALLWCWILLSLFALPTLFGLPWLGAVLFVIGLLFCWQAFSATTDPVYTIGTKREVRTGRVDSPGVECDECGRPAEGGEYRRYEERRVLFGTTVAVSESGENVYCERCTIDPSDAVHGAAGIESRRRSGADEGRELESERS